jgi:hypothetical protein
MDGKQEELWKGNLQFFGKATAAISHEIKNIIAIIGENAGLLEDLLLMSEKGVELKPDRLRQISERIQKQTIRADLTAKRLNEFSHSSDELIKLIDPLQLVEMVLSLARRFASLRDVTLEMMPEAKGPSITTDPFSLENLLWRCLYFATGQADEKKILHISIAEASEGLKIEISGMSAQDTSWSKSNFPGPEEEILLEHLGASLAPDPERGAMAVLLPLDIETGK